MSSFDDKVYEFIKDASGGGGGGGDTTFDTIYPVGSTVTSQTTEVPFTTGRWQLTGMEGIYEEEQDFNAGIKHFFTLVMNNKYVIAHTRITAPSQVNTSINWEKFFPQGYRIVGLIGPSYSTTHSEIDNVFAYNFTDDKGAWTIHTDPNNPNQLLIYTVNDPAAKYWDFTTLLIPNLNNFTPPSEFEGHVLYQFIRTQ